MNVHTARAWDSIHDIYDHVVNLHPDGIKVTDSLDQVTTIVRDEAPHLYAAMADLQDAYVRSTVQTERRSRSRRSIDLFDRVNDAITDHTLWGEMDPILDLALPVGSVDGTDKTLRYWVVDDWLHKLGASAENIEAAVEADKRLRASINRIVSAMAASGARQLGDLQ